MADKTKGQLLREELFYTKKSAFETMKQVELDAVMDYAEGYKKFIDAAKTEEKPLYMR